MRALGFFVTPFLRSAFSLLSGAGKMTGFSLETLALSDSVAWSKIKPLQAGSVEDPLSNS